MEMAKTRDRIADYSMKTLMRVIYIIQGGPM